MPVKEAHPELGDNTEEGTTFPIALDGLHSEYEEGLKVKAPERHKAYLERKARILELTGAERFRDLMGREGDREFIQSTREHLLSVLADEKMAEEKDVMLKQKEGLLQRAGLRMWFAAEDMAERIMPSLRSKRLKEMEGDLHRNFQAADELITDVIKTFFPDMAETISMTNEVRDSHDPAYLLALAMDNKWADKARYEAKRKLILMELMANLEKVVMEEKKNGNNLASFHDLMNRYVYSHEGKKKGDREEKLLVARHGGKNFRNLEWRLEDVSDQESIRLAENGPDMIMKRMGFRSFRVGENGHSREVEFMTDSRHKDRNSLALKLLRKDTNNPKELLGDLNGVRYVFQAEDHIDLFEMTMSHRLRGAGYEVDFTRSKSAVGSDKALSCRKYNVEISKDGKRHSFELQIFTIEEYLNYLYSTPHSWDEYEVRRFFESSSSEALFPSSIYEQLALIRRDVASQAQERARRQPKETQSQMDDMERTDITVTPLSVLPAEADEPDQYQTETQHLS